MKKSLLAFFSILMVNGILYGQNKFIVCEVSFENPAYYYCFSGVYTIVNNPSPSNFWQVCEPNKPIFNESLSPTHAILTDNTGPYPVNDTSVFILKTFTFLTGDDVPVVGGWYKFDSDSLKDFGRIDISYDHGITWKDILTDTTIYWHTQKPVFTGRVYQWREFNASWIYYPPAFDTVYYRYTFISDSIQTNQQGWMLDDIYVTDHIEGIQSREREVQLSVFPNPSRDIITLLVLNFHGSIEVSIYDLLGGLRLQQTLFDSCKSLDISSLPNGAYIMRVNLGDQPFIVKLLKG